MPGDDQTPAPNNGRTPGLRVWPKRTKKSKPKEEVEQMLSNCPTTSYNRNVDSFIILANLGLINPLDRVSRGSLEAKQRLKSGYIRNANVEAFPLDLGGRA